MSKSLRLANHAILALNQLSGRGQKANKNRRIPACSSDAIHRIGSRFLELDLDFAEGSSPQCALNDLISASGIYTDDRGDLQPYTKDKVSWPATGAVPLAVHSALPPADRLWWDDWASHMLRDPQESIDLQRAQALTRLIVTLRFSLPNSPMAVVFKTCIVKA